MSEITLATCLAAEQRSFQKKKENIASEKSFKDGSKE